MDGQSGHASPRQPGQAGAGSEADETSIRFIKRVAELAGIERETAADAVFHVLCVFEQRVSGGEAKKMEDELPAVATEALQECERQDPEMAEPFDAGELFRRVAARLPEGAMAAGRVVAAVLAAVRERLSPEEAVHIGNQLPRDIRALWDEPMPEEVPFPHLPGLQWNKSRRLALSELAANKPNRCPIAHEKFLEGLATQGNVDEGQAEVAAAAVLWPLERRIPAPVADQLNEELPREMQILLQDALLHRDEDVPDWALAGYYRQVAEQLNGQRRDAMALVHLVFSAVREIVSEKTMRHVASELPYDMKDVWLGIRYS
jgi:uncharacterized protein (DUF2267 family)